MYIDMRLRPPLPSWVSKANFAKGIFYPVRIGFDRPPSDQNKRYHMLLFAENEAGYRNLLQLSSKSFLEGYYYKPRMDWELLEKYHDGLIATTGCLGGHVLQALLQGVVEPGRVRRLVRHPRGGQ